MMGVDMEDWNDVLEGVPKEFVHLLFVWVPQSKIAFSRRVPRPNVELVFCGAFQTLRLEADKAQEWHDDPCVFPTRKYPIAPTHVPLTSQKAPRSYGLFCFQDGWLASRHLIDWRYNLEEGRIDNRGGVVLSVDRSTQSCTRSYRFDHGWPIKWIYNNKRYIEDKDAMIASLDAHRAITRMVLAADDIQREET